ncbi:MAG: MFS transporter, partial [Chloroflexota bacterium]|nr:MFS transporter [Chloroflexota bacterium]
MHASASPDLAQQPTPADAAPRESLFINRNFFLLWLGQTGSVFGDFVFNTTLVVWIAASIGRGQSWAPLAVSGVFIAAAAPAILVAPWSGALVDRMSKRWTILGAYAVSLAITLALIPATGLLPIGPLASFHPSTTWMLGAIYIAVAGLAACMQFSSPASLALIGQIVSEPSRPRAMGFMQGSMSLGMLVGPALAAPLLLAFGAQWALLINAASFAMG